MSPHSGEEAGASLQLQAVAHAGGKRKFRGDMPMLRSGSTSSGSGEEESGGDEGTAVPERRPSPSRKQMMGGKYNPPANGGDLEL